MNRAPGIDHSTVNPRRSPAIAFLIGLLPLLALIAVVSLMPGCAVVPNRSTVNEQGADLQAGAASMSTGFFNDKAFVMTGPITPSFTVADADENQLASSGPATAVHQDANLMRMTSTQDVTAQKTITVDSEGNTTTTYTLSGLGSPVLTASSPLFNIIKEWGMKMSDDERAKLIAQAEATGEIAGGALALLKAAWGL